MRNPACSWRYTAGSDDFAKIAGSPLAYWTSDAVRSCFENGTPLHSYADSVKGLDTCDNNRFVRLWQEVDFDKIGLGCHSCGEAKALRTKWFPYCKGGDYRKWYGNFEHVVNWENDGQEIRNFRNEDGSLKSRPQNMNFYFRKGTTAIPQKSPCACSLQRRPSLTQLIKLRLGLSQGPALHAETLAMRSKALPFLCQVLGWDLT